MNDITVILILTLCAGITMPAGALLAYWENVRPLWLKNELRHSILAFGGGALFASVALVLIPEGIQHQPLWFVIVFFSCGGLAFMALDRWLSRSKLKASNLIAMMSDFIPEAMALGAIFTTSRSKGVLLSLLIAVQNLPEAFNAFREMHSSESNVTPQKTILSFFLLAFLGPICGLIGYYYLAQFTDVISAIMLFASGGILYIVFQDIAPQVKLERAWGPPLGAVVGFLVGLIGHSLTL